MSKRTKATFTVKEFMVIYERIPRTGVKGCKEWPYRKNRKGYPEFSLPEIDTSTYRGNRLALSLHLGRCLAPGMLACHSCDNPSCVAFEHLFEGTPAQNSEDMSNKGRNPKGDDHYTRKFPEKVMRGDNHYHCKRPEARQWMYGDNNPAVKYSERLRRGDNSTRGKLTTEQVLEIRELYAKKIMSQSNLGRMYGVSQAAISKIVRNEHWHHI